MATQSNFLRTFQTNAAISAFTRVVVSPNGYISVAAVDQLGIGILQEDVTSNSYENAVVRLWGTGTFRAIVTGLAVTAGDRLVCVTNGLVAGTNGLVGNSGVVCGMLVAPSSAVGGTTAATNPVVELAFQG